VVAAPAYAYKPLEIEKGLGAKGAMLNFPVVNVTADLIVRPERFPAQFGEQSRQWFLQKFRNPLLWCSDLKLRFQ
jgi:hypothetical protein